MNEAAKKDVLYYLNQVNRPGMAELTDFLCESDFFTAPASTVHHGAYESGLAQHSLHVVEGIQGHGELSLSPDTCILCGLLHDLCKVNYYVRSKKSLPRKDENGNLELDKYGKKIWDEIDVWDINDSLPLGHGEKSLYIIQKYIRLTDEEAAMIRWHMGPWTAGVKTDPEITAAYRAACKKWPGIVALHIADLEASTFIDDMKKGDGNDVFEGIEDSGIQTPCGTGLLFQ